MMEQLNFQPLLDAAELLDNQKKHDLLLQMQTVCQQKLYFVAFIGQYSAGKSCLLNNLLKRRLLPEGTTETTPLLTYIRYGEREEAKLHYMDGAVQILELGQVAELAQQVEGGRWDLERMEYLEVYLREDMLRSGMILLDTPGINTLIERHERLLENSLSIAASIVYVAGHAPSLVDIHKMSMLADAGFEVTFVRTHCDEIKTEEETLDQVKETDRKSLAKCGVASECCYYVSNNAKSSLYAGLEPLRSVLMEKGKRAGIELYLSMERQLLVLAEQCRISLENRRTLLEQLRMENEEVLEKRQTKLLEKIKMLESRMEETESSIRKRIESCCRTLQGDVKQQLEVAIQSSEERIERNTEIVDETKMAMLLRQEAAAFSRNAYQLINASLDPLVLEINGSFSAGEIGLETLTLPQAINYQELCTDQDELAAHLRTQLAAIQESQADLIQTLTSKIGGAEYIQLQQELQELERLLVEVQQNRAALPPYVPQMVAEEDGRIQPSQIARSIGAAIDWAMLLIPGAQVESILLKTAKAPEVVKVLGKFVGILENVGKAAKQGDTIKDILFALKNLSDHTRTSKRREKIAEEVVAKVAKGAGAGLDVLCSAKQNNDFGSILDMLTIEHWAEKFGAQFDHPPHLVVDKEYEVQYKEAKDALEQTFREAQQRAYKKKIEMGLFQKEEEQLRAREESLRIDQETVSKELQKRESKLRSVSKQEAIKKWRLECAVWYQEEMEKRLQEVLDAYIEGFPLRLEEYQGQRLQALRDALEKEQASYNGLKNVPEDEITLELQHIKELLESINDIYHG